LTVEATVVAISSSGGGGSCGGGSGIADAENADDAAERAIAAATAAAQATKATRQLDILNAAAAAHPARAGKGDFLNARELWLGSEDARFQFFQVSGVLLLRCGCCCRCCCFLLPASPRELHFVAGVSS
jgi:hypothetical protein